MAPFTCPETSGAQTKAAPSASRDSSPNSELPKPLAAMTTSDLRIRFRETVGRHTASRNRAYLVKAIELAEERLRRRAPTAGAESSLAQEERPATAFRKPRDARIPPVGTVLERDHGNGTVRVAVREDGFEFRGKTYRSLSAVAKAATGTVWNGLLFFKLIPYKRPSRRRAEA